MSADTVLEAIPTERLRTELTRKVVDKLALSDAPTAASARVTGRDLARAVEEAVGELVGSSRLFLVRDGDPALTGMISAVMEILPEVVARRRQALAERNVEALVDVFLGADPLRPAMPAIERDNAVAQAAFLKRWPVLTSETIARQAAHASANPSATASRWKRAQKIFDVRAGGRQVYPAFQFREGRPHPTIAKVLAALPDAMSGWQTAFWFTGPNGWLRGQTPIDRLNDEAAVIVAAERERDAWMG